ncbi:MAG: hypothetical protein II575_11720 [Bacteroidales bacterium]|nr:hypothetical protein [Bacteroidales bacterium]MBQ2574883.1 hypothetical protein [Bacteroidales bacterium]
MKKIVFLAAALMASMFILTSCEKENVAEMIENNATNNVKAANYVLVQKDYVDAYGFVGDLYVDENNPANRFCALYEQQPQTRAHQKPKYTGHLIDLYAPDPDDPQKQIWIGYYCDIDKDNKDCYPTGTDPNTGLQTFSTISPKVNK